MQSVQRREGHEMGDRTPAECTHDKAVDSALKALRRGGRGSFRSERPLYCADGGVGRGVTFG